jgi:hypothetical protein
LGVVSTGPVRAHRPALSCAGSRRPWSTSYQARRAGCRARKRRGHRARLTWFHLCDPSESV